MLPLRFVPYDDLGSTPNVIVDGSPTTGTALTLSHWPGSPTPPVLRDDLSAQIAFHALEQPSLFDGIHAVSNNHFDQDGCVSIYALTDPAAALARRQLAIDVARAGDFGTFESRDAARLSFVISAFEDPARSPLDPAILDGDYPTVCGRLYAAVVPRMTELLDHPERSRELWADEDAHLGRNLDAIADGVVTVDERPDLDLAIFTVPEDWTDAAVTRFTQTRTAALHPMAVDQSTSRFRVLTVQGRRYRLECRYETWVMLTSQRVAPRPDLRPFADVLAQAEPGAARWRADRPGALTPQLQLVDGDESGLEPAVFVDLLERLLHTAPAAWDPFDGAPS